MKSTNEQILEEMHQDNIDVIADEWENERKWYQGIDSALIEVAEEIPLTPKAKINFINEHNP